MVGVVLIEIEEDVVFDKILLFQKAEFREGLGLGIVRPSVLVDAFQGIVPAAAEQVTDGDVHEVLFLLLCKLGFLLVGFLDADQKENSVQVRSFSKSFHQLCFQFRPALGQGILSSNHGANLVKNVKIDG